MENTPSRVSQYFNALLKGLDTISDEIVVRFLLFVLSNLVEAISSSTNKESRSIVQNGKVGKLMELLDGRKNEDVEMASKVLAHLTIITGALPAGTIDAFLTWVQRELISKSVKLSYVLQALMVVLRDNSVRDAFQEQGGVAILARLVIHKVGKYSGYTKYAFACGFCRTNEKQLKNLDKPMLWRSFVRS